ncbi:hypothetical protein BCW_B0008 (plasmid) [Bacillus cereus W]|uniref:Uncharacterized protein n=1 Tax=Bacillus cereus TaxID=1396 RepID=A0A161QJJ0_BACCE|nr:hypothetical protein BCW_B0008 [Bacillus cereus W]EJV56073.1 hypothetical protein IEO_05574 [Bacillus wiedmannii]KZD36514.1 hypothetical protein B4082_2331 [Bacillus cereus]
MQEESMFSLCMVAVFFAALGGFAYVMERIDKRFMKGEK